MTRWEVASAVLEVMPGELKGSQMKIPATRISFPDEDRRRILSAIDEVLRTGQLTLGSHTKKFEEAVAGRVGVSYAVGVNSGTSALEIILRALGVAGRSVIVPTNTFFATPAAVLHAGGHVVFADVRRDNLCLDTKAVERWLRADTTAVIMVHIGGTVPPEIDELRALCDRAGVALVEDAAHAHGSTHGERQAGSFGDAASFSFYPTKVVTSGEGGMIVTGRRDIYERALVLRDQGKAGFHENYHVDLGYNWRLSEIHAVIGLAQFERLDEFVGARRNIAAIYDRGLRKLAAARRLWPVRAEGSNYYKYVAMLNERVDRQAFKEAMKQRGVQCGGEVYATPCHAQPIFERMNEATEGGFPNADAICAKHVCLPMSAVMTEAEAEFVVRTAEEILG